MASVRVSYPAYDREQLCERLRTGLTALARTLEIKRAVLFGSYAKGRQTAASDVDLLIVYAGAPRPDAYSLVRRTLALRRLEPHIYSEAEYEQVKPTLEKMLQGGIPIEIGAG